MKKNYRGTYTEALCICPTCKKISIFYPGGLALNCCGNLLTRKLILHRIKFINPNDILEGMVIVSGPFTGMPPLSANNGIRTSYNSVECDRKLKEVM